jgi:uncharacterized membrane protein
MAIASMVSEKAQRFGSIDAVRGAAILFVFLSHFTAGYPWTSQSQESASYLRTLSMIASPTFVIVSGMVAGFLAVTSPSGYSELRVKLFDRGIFLLAFGHLLLTMTLAPTQATFWHAYQTSFITDVIAVAILIGPSLIVVMPGWHRIAMAVVIFVADWWLIVHWHPLGGALTAKLYLIGRISDSGQLSSYAAFPVLPWFAVYLGGTVLGERVGRMYVRGARQESHFLLAHTGLICFGVATVTYIIAKVLRAVPTNPTLSQMNQLTFLSIYGKFPPGIVYLGFFGGAGLMMLAVIFELDRLTRFPRLFEELRKLGRSSLFMFTIQYALYRALLPRLGLHYTPFWPLIFLGTVVFLTLLAEVWDNHTANRYLTVGITAEWLRWKAERSAVRSTSPLTRTAAG